MPALLKGLIFDFATFWSELFLAEQARIVQLLVEQVDVQEDALKGAYQGRGPCEPGRGIAAGREERCMTLGVETKLDGETLVARIPMRFQRRGGRKRIVAPDGSELVPASKPEFRRHASEGSRAGVAVAAAA